MFTFQLIQTALVSLYIAVPMKLHSLRDTILGTDFLDGIEHLDLGDILKALSENS